MAILVPYDADYHNSCFSDDSCQGFYIELEHSSV